MAIGWLGAYTFYENGLDSLQLSVLTGINGDLCAAADGKEAVGYCTLVGGCWLASRSVRIEVQ